MKKFLITIIALSFCLSGCGNNNQDSSNDNEIDVNSYTASRTSSLESNESNDNTNTVNTQENNNQNTNTETELSSFSTKIYTPNDKARQNNIKITCSKLNGTLVKPRRNIFFL